VQEPEHWGVYDGVHEPVWTAGTIPDSVMKTLEEATEEEAAELVRDRRRAPKDATGQAGNADSWKPMVGCLLGWIVGGATGYVGLLWGLGSLLGVPSKPSIVLLVVCALFSGLVATGIRLAFSWSSSGWNKMRPKRLVLRLVVSTVIFSVTILVTVAIVVLIVIRHGGGIGA
jgi:hypothetical protein